MLSKHLFVAVCWVVVAAASPCLAQTPAATKWPWMDPRLAPDRRAALLLSQITPEEKLRLLSSTSAESSGVAGLVPGIARLGLQAIKESDAGLGVALKPQDGVSGRDEEATPLPSGLALAATWNPQVAYMAGAMIAEEARRKGISVLLGGAANLARDPRAGRNFEYAGEDPLLTGTIVGEAIRGIGDRHVISTMKHFALNDQETNRTRVDARIDRAALRESDLLAFEIANERGHPGAVMCAYNLIGGVHACEDDWLLDRVLRQQWGFRGWVMSDWGAVHSTVRAARAGLDQESGHEWDSQVYFGKKLLVAVGDGTLPQQHLDAMAGRILRTLFASGVIDEPPQPAPLDAAADARVAERVAHEGIVLLQNRGDLLPLSHHIGRLAVIGGHADVGVLSGGGSSQVMPIGGPALRIGGGTTATRIFDPSSPLKAIAAIAPQARLDYADGGDIAAAVALAQRADAAIVFATKWESEGNDATTLALPDGQDRLIAAVASVNPRTIVVLETGNPVLLPWRGQAAAILEAWYPGARGGEAIAAILFGDAEPAGRLPLTFPADAKQLPRPVVPGRDVADRTFPVDYREGAAIGYKWFDARQLTPLYPFGFGLSYTRFAYSELRVAGDEPVTVSFTVTNEGGRAGADVPQLYATIPGAAGAATTRLLGWRKVELMPGESSRVTLTIDQRLLAHFDGEADAWRVAAGDYRFALGANARDPRLIATAPVKAAMLPP
jgi:beta-glucosidase